MEPTPETVSELLAVVNPSLLLCAFAAWAEAITEDYKFSRPVVTALHILAMWARIAERRVDEADRSQQARWN